MSMKQPGHHKVLPAKPLLTPVAATTMAIDPAALDPTRNKTIFGFWVYLMTDCVWLLYIATRPSTADRSRCVVHECQLV